MTREIRIVADLVAERLDRDTKATRTEQQNADVARRAQEILDALSTLPLLGHRFLVSDADGTIIATPSPISRIGRNSRYVLGTSQPLTTFGDRGRRSGGHAAGRTKQYSRPSAIFKSEVACRYPA